MINGTFSSPYTWGCTDYLGRRLTISIPFNETTRAILNGIAVHRDVGCLWSRVVWGVPTVPTSQRSPAAPEGDSTITANQFRNATGFTTVDEILAVQITAEV